MANANPNYSALVATTIENRSTEIADLVSNSNVILTAIKKAGGAITKDGGTSIVYTLATAENDNATFYSGAEILPTGTQDVISAAKFDWKQAAVPVTISGLEQLSNSGKAEIIDMVEGQVNIAISSLKNRVAVGLYSDGTLYGGKGITGLQAALPLANTSGTYGGIDRSAFTVWRNSKWKCSSVDGSAACSASNIQSYMNSLYARCSRGTDNVNLIILDPAYYAFYEASLQVLQRFNSPEKGELGYLAYKYKGADVVMEQTASGISASTGYFLNTDYLKFVTHAKRNFTVIGPDNRTSTNQDASVQMIGWMGNLVCFGPKFNGVIQE